MIQACFILKTVLSIKRPMQEKLLLSVSMEKNIEQRAATTETEEDGANDHHFLL